jgi:MtN3 and saliva related transmembrane protein|tara:strand:+ start:376 stop:636 length:261 start_codon:yes stop_codon:yes gene_type:complete
MIHFISEYIGFFAALCTTIAFVPQAIKVYQTKSTKDISILMFLIFTVGVLSWLIYGLIINDYPVILANAVTLILSLFILVYKIKYK